MRLISMFGSTVVANDMSLQELPGGKLFSTSCTLRHSSNGILGLVKGDFDFISLGVGMRLGDMGKHGRSSGIRDTTCRACIWFDQKVGGNQLHGFDWRLQAIFQVLPPRALRSICKRIRPCRGLFAVPLSIQQPVQNGIGETNASLPCNIHIGGVGQVYRNTQDGPKLPEYRRFEGFVTCRREPTSAKSIADCTPDT